MTLIDRLKYWFGRDQAETNRTIPSSLGLPERAYTSPSQGRRKRRIPDLIETYYVPTAILWKTQKYIEEHGDRSQEAYVFWTGAVAGDEAYVMSCVYPTTNARRGGVKVSLEKMTEINRELYRRDQLILAQVHSHPGAARHSGVDEKRR